MLRSLDTIYYIPDLGRISQPKLISARTFFWFTEDGDLTNEDQKQITTSVNQKNVLAEINSGWEILTRSGI